jgi:CDP-glucose 4,6-dehydratase
VRPFITGATGLIGGWLVETLISKGIEPVCLVRDGVPRSRFHSRGLDKKAVTVTGDLSDVEMLSRVLVEYEVDTVFHLAAQTIVRYGDEGPLATFDTNVAGTWNVLEAARRKRGIKRVVVASSDKAYGQQLLPYNESMPVEGCYPYDVSKSCADLIARAYHKSYGLPVVVVRCSNVYGPGDLNWSRIIPRTIRFAHKGDVELLLRAGGLMKRDYIHLSDVVSAYLLVARHPDAIGHAFNFGNGEPVTTVSVVHRILALMNYHGVTPTATRDGANEIEDQWMDCRKAREMLGWKPSTSLEHGLIQTIAWYMEFLDGQEKTEAKAETA